MSRGVPREARDLIARHIHSVAQLETLLLMRSRAGEETTAEDVGRDQKIGLDMAEGMLADLVQRGFLMRSGEKFVYEPTADVAAQIDVLAEAYKGYRVSVINLIFSRPDESVQSFADAFRVRKDEE